MNIDNTYHEQVTHPRCYVWDGKPSSGEECFLSSIVRITKTHPVPPIRASSSSFFGLSSDSSTFYKVTPGLLSKSLRIYPEKYIVKDIIYEFPLRIFNENWRDTCGCLICFGRSCQTQWTFIFSLRIILRRSQQNNLSRSPTSHKFKTHVKIAPKIAV